MVCTRCRSQNQCRIQGQTDIQVRNDSNVRGGVLMSCIILLYKFSGTQRPRATLTTGLGWSVSIPECGKSTECCFGVVSGSALILRNLLVDEWCAEGGRLWLIGHKSRKVSWH